MERLVTDMSDVDDSLFDEHMSIAIDAAEPKLDPLAGALVIQNDRSESG